MITRFTKFPFVFWSFGKATKCEIKANQIIINHETYEFRPFNKLLFLLSKYLILVVIFAFLVNRYDLSLEKIKIAQYCISCIMIGIFFYFDDVLRKILIVLVLVGSFILELFVFQSPFFATYIIKYFIVLLSIFMFVTDLNLHAYNLIKNDKVVSNFLTKVKI